MAETTQQNDTRAAVEAAFQHHEQAGDSVGPTSAIEPEPVSTPAETPTEPAATSRERDEVGRFAPKPKDSKPEAAPEEKKPEQKESAPTAGAEPKPTEQPKAGPPKNAPLPPAVREEWEKIPESTRQYILKREGEAARLMSQTAEARRTHEALSKTLEPYRDMLTGEPMQVVGNLLQTAAVLKKGSPQEKAQLAAQMISGYDIDIETLAGVLEGLPAQRAQAQQFRDPRVDALEQRLAREEALRQHEYNTSAAATYKAFAEKAEFLESTGVREAMYQEMLQAGKRGVELSYEQAYNKVVWSLDETREVLLERERQKSSGGTAPDKAAIQRAKHAASSVKTDPGMGRVTTDNSIEALIRAQLDNAR